MPTVASVGPPLGILYLARELEAFGHEVIVRDLNRQFIEPALLDDIRCGRVGMIGFSMLSYARKQPYELIRKFKRLNSNVRIVIGGIHATTLPMFLVNNLPIDAAAIGEGEQTIVELAEVWLRGNGRLCDVQSIATPQHGMHKPGALIKNLDHLRPSYMHSSIDWYQARMAQDRPDYVINGIRLGDTSFFSMITSRGCIGRCSFCNAFDHWGRKVRFRSAQDVVDEIEFLYRHFGVNMFVFYDDSFGLKKKLVLEMCDEIVKRNIKILWYTSARVDSVDEEMLAAMKKAGCFSIAYGVESGSPTILRNMNKNITPEQIKRAVRLTKDAGIKSYMLLMVGNLGETDKTIKETAALIKESDPDLTSLVGHVMVFPGTAYSEIMTRRGDLTDDYWLTPENAAPVFYDNFTDADLARWVDMVDTKMW
jgi:radical SAM superfamily enzyme YgiQ (UPF0313 family)